MDFNETNVAEKWNEWFPESVEVDISDSDTECDVWSVAKLPFTWENLRIVKETFCTKNGRIQEKLSYP